jgi:hypothetical protein
MFQYRTGDIRSEAMTAETIVQAEKIRSNLFRKAK